MIFEVFLTVIFNVRMLVHYSKNPFNGENVAFVLISLPKLSPREKSSGGKLFLGRILVNYTWDIFSLQPLVNFQM